MFGLRFAAEFRTAIVAVVISLFVVDKSFFLFPFVTQFLSYSMVVYGWFIYLSVFANIGVIESLKV